MYLGQFDEEALRRSLKANCGRQYQQCSLSLMDTIADPDITFDRAGISNYYYDYKQQEKAIDFPSHIRGRLLEEMFEKVRRSGEGKPYDCITGVSGGVDSTYLALQAKRHGLRPLVVHFDNGWNSELAVQNIHNIITILGFDLNTLVVDWSEFRDIQRAYFKASVVDIEAITDHAIIATLYKLALEHDIKYVLSGTNIVTEAILPSSWIFNKNDFRNLVDIHRKFGEVPLRTFPLFTTYLKKRVKINRIHSLAPLNYLSYNKAEVKSEIAKQLNWRDYGGKHYESIFTRFYQGYILPVKFNIDKRKAHLSNLIFSGQITKEQAIEELKKPIYPEEQFNSDFQFVLKKLGFSESEFLAYLKMPRREHSEYRTERSIYDEYLIARPFRRVGQFVSSVFRVQ